MLSLSYIFTLPLLASATFTQVNYYDQASCAGKTPIFAVTSSYLGATAAQCSANPSSNYAHQETVTSEVNPLVLTGSIRNYVSQQIFTSSDTCTGEVSQSFAIAADAICHAMPNSNSQWISANCNGGQPIFNSCWDSACTNCTTYQYLNQCNQMSAGVSMKVVCNPANSVTSRTGAITGGAQGDDGTDSDSSALTASMSFVALIIAYMLI